MAIKGEWIPHCGFKSKADAHKVALELEGIGYNNNNDEFRTQDMVDFARNNPTSELYKLFEWNDAIAAEAYRNKQAGDILRFLKVTIIKEDEETPVEEITRIRYFINTGKNDGTYKKTDVIFQNASEADRIMENMKRDAENFINRYQIYAHLNPNIPSVIQALQVIINP